MQPEPKDPGQPTKPEGAFSWSDLGPLASSPRVALSLPFTVGALIVATWWLRELSEAASTPGVSAVLLAGGIVHGFGAVMSVLLPVALLWRVPSALRSRTRLFLGLAVLAALQVVAVLGGFWQVDPGAGSPLFTLQSSLEFIVPIGSALVAFGLLDLRVRRPARSSLLIVLVVIYVGLEVSQALIIAIENALGPNNIAGGGISWWAVLTAVVAAFTAWIVLDAWFEREPPTQFWTLLSAAVLLGLATRIVAVPESVAVVVFQSIPPAAIGTLIELVSTVAVVLAFTAYLRFTPRPPEPAAGDESGGAPRH